MDGDGEARSGPYVEVGCCTCASLVVKRGNEDETGCLSVEPLGGG